LREVIRLMRAMVALYCASYDRPPASVTLDIDDTLDVVHGHQQLSMFNAHYDERCFLPIHVCNASIRMVWASIWMDDAGVGRRLGVARP